jgi:hypothetical protein
MEPPPNLRIGRQHAVMHWRELSRSFFTLILLSGALLLLQALWWPLAWLVIVGNLVFVVPTLIQCGIAAVGFPLLLVSGELQKDERLWGFLVIAAFLANMILEVGWLIWAGSRLIR